MGELVSPKDVMNLLDNLYTKCKDGVGPISPSVKV